jgi:excisionase family DNA binding protein
MNRQHLGKTDGAEMRIQEGKMAPLITVSKAADLLHVHQNTLRRWTNQGVIKAFRIGIRGDRRYSLSDVQHLLSELESHYGNFREVKEFTQAP